MIITMGDFNDTPVDKSIAMIVNSHDAWRSLTNIFANPKDLNYNGSHKYQGIWSQLDQMMISSNMKEYYKDKSAHIFMPSFILTGENPRSKRPLRTFNGFKYEGGFSDHLPIVAEFIFPLIH